MTKETTILHDYQITAVNKLLKDKIGIVKIGTSGSKKEKIKELNNRKCECKHLRKDHNKRQKNSNWIGCDICNCKCFREGENG